MAFEKACNAEANAIKNTGIECDTMLDVTNMLFFVDANYQFDETDIAGDFATFAQQQVHATGSGKFYPVKYIWDITDSDENDVTETSPITGQINTIRNGAKNRVFQIYKGGICHAKALQSLADRGSLAFIELDASARVGLANNVNGTYSGMPCIVNRQTPLLATGTTKFKNRIGISYSVTDYVNRVEIFQADTDVLSVEGLKDVVVTSAAVATATTVTVDLKTECAGTDLGAIYGADITSTEFVINKLTGTAPNYTRTPVAITNAAYTNGHYVLTFASQTSGTKLEVKGSAASVWYTDDIVGYEAITPVIITTP